MKDIFSGFHVIKNFNIEKNISKEFYKYNYSTESSSYKYSKFAAFSEVLAGFLSYLVFFSTLGIASYLVYTGDITIGTLVGVIQLNDVLILPITNVAYEIIEFKAVKDIKNKLLHILNENDNNDEGHPLEHFDRSVEFKNVTFAYEEEHVVLKNINLIFEKGKKYAIVGQSGSGKSTLLKLLLRDYDNFKGEICVDGINHRNIKMDSLYKIISIIHQNVFMFDSSVRDNICLYNDYSDKQLMKAVKLSGLTGVIERLKNGVNSSVGEDGSNLSGGERQRISIARALIRSTLF